MHRSAVLFACVALALASCRSAQFSGNSLVIEEPTTGSNDLTLTLRVGMDVKVSGMRVDTVGQDTIVTRLDKNRARRFILSGMVGYRGFIRLDSVDLVLGDTAVWIDGHSIKLHGPDGTIDLRLQDDAGKDVFGGRDLVLSSSQIEPVRGSNG